jgi:hypothetical protein
MTKEERIEEILDLEKRKGMILDKLYLISYLSEQRKNSKLYDDKIDDLLDDLFQVNKLENKLLKMFQINE